MIPLSSSNSDGQNNAQVNVLMQDFQHSKVTQIFKDDTGTRRVLLGKGKDDFYGLKVSEPGKDVYTATNDDLIFNSSQNVFKIVSKLPISVTYSHTVGTSEYKTATLAHGLGYTPAFMAFHNLDSKMVTHWGFTPSTGNRPNPAVLPAVIAGVGGYLAYADVTVDGTNIYFALTTQGAEPTGSYTFSATVYLLQETFS